MEDELAALARTTAPRPLRCAVYARVSVEDGQDKQMPSIEVQTQACRAFIEAHRHENWLALDAVYADNGYSGGNLQRPALRRLLDDMQSDQIDVVVVHRFDRLSRSIFDLETLLPLFTIPGIRLVSVTQPLDTESPEGRLNLHLLTSFAQFERELIGEVYYAGEWHRGTHRPIVDLALWDRVHEMMTQRARRTGTPNQGRDLLDFPLAGRLFWQDGRAFSCFESSSRKGKRYRYYTAPTGDQPDDS